MKVVLKEINVFLWICIINYTNYKSSHPVSYDLVSTCRLVALKLKKNTVGLIQVFDDLWSGVKLRALNTTKILFSKHMNDSCGAKIKTHQSL